MYAYYDIVNNNRLHYILTLLVHLIFIFCFQRHVVQNWGNDEEFGRQILNGPNPTKIVQVKELPEDFPVTNELVKHRMDSLEDELKVHSHLCDFVINTCMITSVHIFITCIKE